MSANDWTRRRVLRGVAGGAAALAGVAMAGRAARAADEDKGEGAIPAGEDLMREHGVLARLLLIYDEAQRRVNDKQDFPFRQVNAASTIIRDFIEKYHELNEEKYIFPAFQKVGNPHAGLVKILLDQHRAGRWVTRQIIGRTKTRPPYQHIPQILVWMSQFTVMYRPHAAREATVLFPAYRELVGPEACRKLGEKFEDIEHKVLGAGGFEKTVQAVAELEKQLDIHDLTQYTPLAWIPEY